MSATDDLLWNSKLHALAFGGSVPHGRPGRAIAIVTCMDPRINVDVLFGLRPGDAHVIRNAGGIVTDDIIRSLLLSQRLLGTREVLLLHHTDCGMMTFKDEQLSSQIQVEVGARPPFALGAFADADDDVRQALKRLRATSFLPHRDHVRGFVYDVATGQVREIN